MFAIILPINHANYGESYIKSFCDNSTQMIMTLVQWEPTPAPAEYLYTSAFPGPRNQNLRQQLYVSK